MTLNKINGAVCEIEGCPNMAFRQISYDRNSKSGINICKSCLVKLYNCMAKEVCVSRRGYEKR